jgi:hypothetical protein
VSGERPATHQRHAIPPPPDSEPEELDPEDFEELPELEQPVTLNRLARFVVDGFSTLRDDNRMIRKDVLLLREHVTTVDKRTLVQKVGGAAGKGVAWSGVATLVLTAAAQIAAQYRPGAVGPIQALIKLFGVE